MENKVIELVSEEPDAQVPVESVMGRPEVPNVQVPEVPEQEFVMPSLIPVVEEPSTQEVEEVEMLDNESLVVESSAPKSKAKKVLNYLTGKKKRRILKRAFHVWQIKPHEVAPLSESPHECAACGTEYQGNYCPRCGQSASIGRFSFKKAALLFLDVWGMGNRSMFRSLRDLVLRPGYMIRDYLSGMQSAYFPPFKMFFILLTFMFIIDQGINLNLEETAAQPIGDQTEIVEQEEQVVKEDLNQATDKQKEQQKSPLYRIGNLFGRIMFALWEKNPALFVLLTLLLFLWPLYFFLRHSPNIPDLRFAEFIVAMVYTSNSFSIIVMLGMLFGSSILKVIAVFMIFVTLSQFSGYKKRRILAYMPLTLIISVATLALLALGGIGISALLVSK